MSDPEKKLAAKRQNEHLKLGATFLNALSIALIGAAVIIPLVTAPEFFRTAKPWIMIFVAVALHSGAHWLITRLKSEE